MAGDEHAGEERATGPLTGAYLSVYRTSRVKYPKGRKLLVWRRQVIRYGLLLTKSIKQDKLVTNTTFRVGYGQMR